MRKFEYYVNRRATKFSIAVTQFVVAMFSGLTFAVFFAIKTGQLEQVDKVTDLFNIVIGIVFGYPLGVVFGALVIAFVFHEQGSKLSLLLGLFIAMLIASLLSYFTDVSTYLIYYSLWVLVTLPLFATIGYFFSVFKLLGSTKHLNYEKK